MSPRRGMSTAISIQCLGRDYTATEGNNINCRRTCTRTLPWALCTWQRR